MKLGKIKKKTPDPEEGKALLNQAQDRLDYIRGKDTNAKTAKFVFEDAYESIREAAQSLMSAKGFKPYSHEAIISFIKEFYKSEFSEEETYKFDYFRKLRNNSMYRAVPVSKEDVKESLILAEKFVKKIEKLLKG